MSLVLIKPDTAVVLVVVVVVLVVVVAVATFIAIDVSKPFLPAVMHAC